MSLPWRPRLVHGSTAVELELPQRPWVPESIGIGGSEESAAGVIAAWEYRRDEVLRLRLRVWEWEWPAVAAWIAAGQRAESIALNLSQVGVDAPVRLVSPRMGEPITPTLTETPGLYEVEVAVRTVTGTSLFELYYDPHGGENLLRNPSWEDDPPGHYWKKDATLISVVTDPAQAYSGSRYYRIVAPEGTPAQVAAQIDELGDYWYWDIAPGDLVDYGVMIYREEGEGYLSGWVDFLDSSGSPIAAVAGPNVAAEDGWEPSEGITVAPDGARSLRFGCLTEGTNGRTIGRFDAAYLRIRRRS